MSLGTPLVEANDMSKDGVFWCWTGVPARCERNSDRAQRGTRCGRQCNRASKTPASTAAAL